MKQKVDFLIRYEHKVRELESIMLIKCELERRGYSVALIGNYDYKNTVNYFPKVMISPAIYREAHILNDLILYNKPKKVANLLWEQLVLIEEEEDINAPHNIYGLGQQAVTFCWGERTQQRIMRRGMKKDFLPIVGMINTDYLRQGFRNTLLDKNVLSKKYGLDSSKRWTLFISSFAFCELDDLQKDLILKEYGVDYLKENTECANQSRREILQWFKSVLAAYPDDIIIYRPHPDEAKKSLVLKEMEQQYPNFKVIPNDALKHWINAADKVYNWISTGIVDAYFLQKPFAILRPVKIPARSDYRIYQEGSRHISTAVEFLEDYKKSHSDIPVDKALYESYYHNSKEYVYIQICDILEKMYNSDLYDVHVSLKENFYINRRILRNRISSCLKPVLLPFINWLPFFKNSKQSKQQFAAIIRDGYEKNVATADEINDIYKRISPIIYGKQV